MKYYQLTCLISPELSETELKSSQEKINSFIQEEEGVLAEENLAIRKKLAYPIKKRGEAYFTTLNFRLNPEKISSLETKLKRESQILRYLILVEPPVRKARVLRKKLLPLKPELEATKPERKVELKEIEKKLEEILGE